MASRRVLDLIPYQLENSGDKRKSNSLSRHCVVLMLGYIATASYVKRLALAGCYGIKIFLKCGRVLEIEHLVLDNWL